MSFNLAGHTDGEEYKKVPPGEYLAELQIKHIDEVSPKLSYFNLTYTLLHGSLKGQKVFGRLYTEGKTPEKTDTCKRMVRGFLKQAGTTKEQRDAVKDYYEVINLVNKRNYYIDVYEEVDRDDKNKTYTRAALLRPDEQSEQMVMEDRAGSIPSNNAVPF